MKNFTKITFLSILSLSCLPSNADVIIKAGTTITGLNTNDIDNPGLGISVDQETDTFTFTQDVNCATFTQFITTASESGDALTAACNREAGAYLGENADGSITIGKDEAEITVTSEGLSQDGANLLKRTSGGEVHIGENSLVTRELNGKQQLYATDANGNKIPIDITNGSKLLINGRDVEQSINNVGALSAALTGLPTVPTDTTLACGLGTGTHGGDIAFSGGCASKVSEKLSINYAASMTMPGQDYAGDFEDKFSARAGFVWKLGKSNQPTQISMKTKEKMEEKIYSLEEKNEKILSKNKKLENKVSSLMARLERLEKVALGGSISKDLATTKLP